MDHLRVLWRHKWLILLGLIAGLGGGFLYFTRQPPVFRSFATLQVIDKTPRNPLPDYEYDHGREARMLSEESLVIRSDRVLTKAAELGSLSETTIFRGLSNEAIARRLGNTNALEVGPAVEDARTALQVAFTSHDPEDCQRVVQSIVDAYADHLRSQHRDVGQETLQLIEEAEGDVLKKLTDLEREYDQFRQNSPLIYRGDKMTSVHRENAENLLTQKQSLVVQLTQLQSRYDSVKSAVERNEPLEAVLLMLSSETDNVISDFLSEDPKLAQLEKTAVEALPRSEQMRQSQLVPLQIQEQQLLSTFAPGHPAVKTLQLKLEMTKDLIAQQRAIEQRNERELKQKLAEAKEMADANQSEGLTLKDRVKFHVIALGQQIKSLEQEKAVVEAAYKSEHAAAQAESEFEIQNQRYVREIERAQNLYDRIVARLDEIEIVKDSTGRQVDPIRAPEYGALVGPLMPRSLGLGAFLGLACAVGLAYLLEWADRSYRDARDISEHLQLPVIGHVPQIGREVMQAKNPDSPLAPVLCTYHKSKGTISEAYRAVRTSLYFASKGGKTQVLQVTSSVPGEGKSTLAANVAITIAQSGKNVLLVDCDFRRPTLHKLLGVESDRGVAWMIDQLERRNDADPSELLGEAVMETAVPNLSVMPRGERPTNPSELLSSHEFETLISAVRQKFDMVIIDTPPMLAVTDPSNVAPRVDGVLFVIRLKKNVRNVADRAAQMLRSLDANVVGVVVNGVGGRESAEYGKYGSKYGYGYNYGSGGRYGYGYNYNYGYGYAYGGYGDKYDSYYEEEAIAEGRERIEV